MVKKNIALFNMFAIMDLRVEKMKEKEILENLVVVKRSGQRVSFNSVKIAIAIKQAFDSFEEDTNNEKKVNKVYNQVLNYITTVYENRKTINVEDIQDIIEDNLKKCGYPEVYKRFNEYRLQRAASREAFSIKEQHKFVKAIEKIGLKAKNYQENTPIDLLLNFGKTISQEFARAYLIESKYNRAHEEGRIFIEDIKSYALKTTASSIIDLSNIESEDITTQTLMIINTIEHFKEEQYMEQTIMNLDNLYENIMLKEFKKEFYSNLEMFFKIVGLENFIDSTKLKEKIMEEKTLAINIKDYQDILLNKYSEEIFNEVYKIVFEKIKEKLTKNLEELLDKLDSKIYKISNNKINISFSATISYESNLIKEIYTKILSNKVYKNITTIIKVNNNFNYLEELINSKNDVIIIYLNNNEYSDEIDCLSDELVLNENINGENTARGKIKLSTITINLARLGLKYSIDQIEDFYKELEETLELSKNALLQRYELQASLYKENYKYIFENSMLYDTKRLEDNKRVRKVLRNGILNISFSGLLEACEALIKNDNNIKIMDLSLEIIKFMQKKINDYTNELKLNFELSEENNNLINKKLLGLDKTMYGNIDILKKDSYSTISSYLNKLGDNLKYKYALKYQNLCQYNLNIIINKSKVLEEIYLANKSKIKIIRVMIK